VKNFGQKNPLSGDIRLNSRGLYLPPNFSWSQSRAFCLDGIKKHWNDGWNIDANKLLGVLLKILEK